MYWSIPLALSIITTAPSAQPFSAWTGNWRGTVSDSLTGSTKQSTVMLNLYPAISGDYTEFRLSMDVQGATRRDVRLFVHHGTGATPYRAWLFVENVARPTELLGSMKDKTLTLLSVTDKDAPNATPERVVVTFSSTEKMTFTVSRKLNDEWIRRLTATVTKPKSRFAAPEPVENETARPR
jgi:hypothetical protein